MKDRTITHDSMDSWLAYRRDRVGASEVAAVARIAGAYSSAWRLYWAKRGAFAAERPSREMVAGTALEPRVAELFSEQTGVRVIRPAPWTTVHHPDEPRLFCTPDFFAVSDDGEPIGVVQAKAVRFWPRTWDDMPDHWVAQVATEAACCGLDRAWLAVLVGGVDLRWAAVDLRSHGFSWMQDVRDFLRRLDEDDPPPPDARDAGAIDRVYPAPEVESVALDWDAAQLADRWLDLRRAIASMQMEMDAVRARLAVAVGKAERGVLPDGRVVHYSVVRRKEYTKTVPESSYRVLRIDVKEEDYSDE